MKWLTARNLRQRQAGPMEIVLGPDASKTTLKSLTCCVENLAYSINFLFLCMILLRVLIWFSFFIRYYELTSMHERTATSIVAQSPEEFVNFNKKWVFFFLTI